MPQFYSPGAYTSGAMNYNYQPSQSVSGNLPVNAPAGATGYTPYQNSILNTLSGTGPSGGYTYQNQQNGQTSAPTWGPNPFNNPTGTTGATGTPGGTTGAPTTGQVPIQSNPMAPTIPGTIGVPQSPAATGTTGGTTGAPAPTGTNGQPLNVFNLPGVAYSGGSIRGLQDSINNGTIQNSNEYKILQSLLNGGSTSPPTTTAPTPSPVNQPTQSTTQDPYAVNGNPWAYLFGGQQQNPTNPLANLFGNYNPFMQTYNP